MPACTRSAAKPSSVTCRSISVMIRAWHE
jgi:hypothetical protein